ncbi:MAG TPA: permease [Streptosporangiaceae bacterium]|jgi:hypothetical protein
MLASLSWADPIARSLRESFFMFWQTLWPLVFGFTLSGAVQAFASREALQRRLGDHRPASVARAAGYGMASSSCSYAASALARSLFAKGADFLAAMVFMVASTNLVIELGIVLAVLMGWQFAASEFAGGAIMIVLLVLLGSLWLRGRLVTQARERLAEPAGGGGKHNPATAGHERAGQHDPASSQHEHAAHGVTSGSWRGRVRSRAGWADAAACTMSDIAMLRREMLIGYLAAGLLATLVPASAWHAAFWPGHGVWTSAENAVAGPLIALVSFVCSIGNVPLAAALWHGGISFGGVVSFLFADLIALPLVLIYRQFYGRRLALRMLGVFWLTMSAAGLATEGLFRAAGLVPDARPGPVSATSFSWDYTSYLNIVFLVVLACLYLAYRSRPVLGGGSRHATDPVCGMQVETASAPATMLAGGERRYFCSDRCRERFASTLQPAPD